jgi:hypothetical protein
MLKNKAKILRNILVVEDLVRQKILVECTTDKSTIYMNKRNSCRVNKFSGQQIII